MNVSHEGEVCSIDDHDSLQVQQEVHEDPSSAVLSDKAMIETTQDGSSTAVHSSGEQHLRLEPCQGHVLFEEASSTLKISNNGNVMVTAHTTDSSDQCKFINLTTGGLQKLITEGVRQ